MNQNTLEYKRRMTEHNLQILGVTMQKMIETQCPLPCPHYHHEKIIMDAKRDQLNLIFCFDCQCYCDGNGYQMPQFKNYK